MAKKKAGGADALKVLAELGVPDEMLFNFQLGAAVRGFSRGTARRRSLRAREIHHWQDETRLKIVEMIGGLPRRTPLAARVTGAFERKSYTVEKLIYESRPGFHVTASLYLPKASSSPAPAALIPCGHSPEGKAAGFYQTAAIALAMNGYVVLCYDPLGQGERSQYWDRRKKRSKVGLCVAEHDMCGNQCHLLGTNLAQWRIWDGMRSIDYLLSRPEVDPDRLLVTGNSGGGTLTAYIAAVDPRVSIAAPGCYITTLEERFRSRLGADPEQNLLPQCAWGVDHVDYLAIMAPKPVMILAAKKDFFPIKGARWAHSELKKLYSKLGAAPCAAKAESPLGHGYTKPLREAMVNFANGHFDTGRPRWREPKIVPEKERTLLCTSTGQVATSFGSRTVFDFNLDLCRSAPVLPSPPRRHDGLAGYTDALRSRVMKALRLHLPHSRPKVRLGAPARTGGLDVERLAIETEKGILVPGLLCRPEGRPRGSVVLASDEGKASITSKNGLAVKLAKAGLAVLAVDPRGIGETESKVVGWGRTEADLASTSWMNDYPLVSGWALDLLQSCEAMAHMKGVQGPVVIGADGVRCATAAIFAMAISHHVGGAAARGPLASYRDIVETEIWRVPAAVFLPGIIGQFDMGDVAGLAAPKPLSVLGAIDARGKALAPKEARRIGLRRAARLYREAGAARSLRLAPRGGARSLEAEILRIVRSTSR